jgi:hypothetical protein
VPNVGRDCLYRGTTLPQPSKTRDWAVQHNDLRLKTNTVRPAAFIEVLERGSREGEKRVKGLRGRGLGDIRS